MGSVITGLGVRTDEEIWRACSLSAFPGNKINISSGCLLGFWRRAVFRYRPTFRRTKPSASFSLHPEDGDSWVLCKVGILPTDWLHSVTTQQSTTCIFTTGSLFCERDTDPSKSIDRWEFFKQKRILHCFINTTVRDTVPINNSEAW